MYRTGDRTADGQKAVLRTRILPDRKTPGFVTGCFCVSGIAGSAALYSADAVFLPAFLFVRSTAVNFAVLLRGHPGNFPEYPEKMLDRTVSDPSGDLRCRQSGLEKHLTGFFDPDRIEDFRIGFSRAFFQKPA